mmetsp:Transcript_18795/g.39358  ORF Transcript_18795/g.39358 Transcript_18795/m.39358 type:complete len:396 (-) Transcript_18795:196-1383(-)
MAPFHSPQPPPQDHNIDEAAAPADRYHGSQPSPPPPRRVNHTYRDFSRFEPAVVSSNRKLVSNFPSKLHMIVSNPEYAHVISWMPHGRAWKILSKDLLVSDVIPQYFGQTKYESFTRQLCGWGFKRLHQSGPDFRAYYHECFLQGLPHLTQLMKRVPANSGRLIPHVEGEPNFYEMSKYYPLPREEQPVQSCHPGFGTPPTYSPPNHDVIPPHSQALSGYKYVPPPPPPDSNFGHGYGPPPNPNSYYGQEHGPPPYLPPASALVTAPHESNGYSYCLLSHPSHATSYAAPHDGDGRHCDSYHVPDSYTIHQEHSGYHGLTSYYYSQLPPPPPPPQQHFDYGHSSRDYHLAAPSQHSLSREMSDPYSSSSYYPQHDSDLDGRSPSKPLPFTAQNDV